jgi:hypothetical protein
MPTNAHDSVFALAGASRKGAGRGRGGRRRRTGRTLLALGLAVGVVGGGMYTAYRFLDGEQTMVREHCTAAVGPEAHELDPDQAANAALIAAVSVRRGMPARAATIGIATAVQESKLRNIDYGDKAGPDSRGLFQQRPSQGWGTQAQVMDPLYAADRFYLELEKFDYRSMEVTDAAQKVQRSAYPLAYADHEPEGRAYASALTGNSPAGLNCVLKRTAGPGDAASVGEQLQAAFGPLPTSVDGRTLSVSAEGNTGWAVAQWAVAHAAAQQTTSVGYAGLVWNRAEDGWVPASTTEGKVVITVAATEGEG